MCKYHCSLVKMINQPENRIFYYQVNITPPLSIISSSLQEPKDEWSSVTWYFVLPVTFCKVHMVSFCMLTDKPCVCVWDSSEDYTGVRAAALHMCSLTMRICVFWVIRVTQLSFFVAWVDSDIVLSVSRALEYAGCLCCPSACSAFLALSYNGAL